MSFRLPIRRLRHHVSSLCTAGFIQSLLPCTTRSSGVPSQLEASLGASPCEYRRDRVTINTLPDDLLVEIFHFCVIVVSKNWGIVSKEWHTLVHVCQRWRHVVFASPRRLNVRVVYTGKRPISELLDVWPVLPVVIGCGPTSSNTRWENVAVALESEHRHRLCQINLWDIPTSHCERLAAAMQKPFPELTFLRFSVATNTVTSLPDSFLRGSAPLLGYLWLDKCPFPGIPKLLLSSKQLVHLYLFNIPNSGYISPQDLVTALSVLSRLETLHLGFPSRLYPASRPPPPLTRSVLPALDELAFQGVHEYLEDLLAQIEVPLLNKLDITFFMDINFVLPQLHRLISRVESFNSCDRAIVHTSDRAIQFSISSGPNRFPDLSLKIICSELDSQLASLAQVCSPSFTFLSTLVQLDIVDDDGPLIHWKRDIETTQWLELLAPFTAMKDLRLTPQVASHVGQALEELTGERVTEVLPALQNIFLKAFGVSGSVPRYLEGFVAARNLSRHPVVVRYWANRT
ncbi:hypothetical protein F5148DRAFT_789137 [Russula earlei]|uniref:Uncharacterized protein n=1 Tax=Russula earlei TaxID=71964 RepID=A0ACC0TTR0_9AGAM|nr:hypothetical protein F5148DRAFT_789137 [Russula earlei]